MTLRQTLRSLPVFDRSLPGFDPADAPAEPEALFADWLREAVGAGVVEPHAMTISTVDADGYPDSRVLLLKDVDADGWQLAGSAHSAKGRELAAAPKAALCFYWREQARQVRVRGDVEVAPRAVAEQDFLARSPAGRAASLIGEQSAVLPGLRDLDERMSASRRLVEEQPELVPEHHTVYRVRPFAVEFWQGDHDRLHVRLRYRRNDGGWARELLWP
jgi:pyridoxamine 5'-phosphate oxidase